MLKTLYESGKLRFFANVDSVPQWAYDININGASINFSKIESMRQFNTNGSYVAEPAVLTFAHELSHGAENSSDPSGGYQSVFQNVDGFDTYGGAVRTQNAIARDLPSNLAYPNGYVDYQRAGYFNAWSSDDQRYGQFSIDTNYSAGREVDVVRLADFINGEFYGIRTITTVIEATSKNSPFPAR